MKLFADEKPQHRINKWIQLLLLVLCLVAGVTPAMAQIQIGGNVFGGGRMADVVGTSAVYVPGQSSVTTTINGVYGGNDIAGGVLDVFSGSKVFIGSKVSDSTTAKAYSVSITEVYGGGNGYYNYPNGSGRLTAAGSGVSSSQANFTAGMVKTFDQSDDVQDVAAVSSAIPTIRKTEVAVIGQNVVIGSLYGGAKNAFVLQSCEVASTVHIRNGVVGYVFGGNNVGGSIPGDINVNVWGTTIPAPSLNSTDYANIGTTFGIKELYGGGNRVAAPGRVTVNVRGGMIDMCFAGGNSATVGGGICSETTNSTTLNLNIASSDAHSIPNVYDVRSVFGGNNQAAMAVLPTLNLTKGDVATVYGGGNAGNMVASATKASIPGGLVTGEQTNLSTYVEINSATFYADQVYGGCRAANVSGTALVNLVNTPSENNITVFGGNDIAGTVGNAKVLLNADNMTYVSVDNIYGGGNGHYVYSGNNVYAYGTNPSAEPAPTPLLTLSSTASVPVATLADVLLTRGTVVQDVYGGGLAGDVATTNVVVEYDADIQGMIFGAGCGNLSEMGKCATHVGNVTRAANLTINGLQNTNRVFGGGRAGDVLNANVTVNENVSHPIQMQSLYGGCLASNLTGITNVVIGEKNVASTTITIDTVYGGNDYSGLTQRTDLEINSGNFVHVFGAGNGVYDYKKDINIAEGRAADAPLPEGNCYDTVPYSMEVNVTYNGGSFAGHVYGGGNMGLVGDKYMTLTSHPEGIEDSAKYGYIHVTIHGGSFADRVYAGARGTEIGNRRFFGLSAIETNGSSSDAELKRANSTVLAYAYKQIDMDGGRVNYSLHGGSEGVDDGYPYECWDSTATTTSQRPSSVVNIVGGVVNKSLYGGGYEGNTFGSIYVNVGKQAVLDCPVWTSTYARTGGSSITLSAAPRFYHFYEQAASLTKSNDLYLQASIYNGSDWGEAGEGQYFSTRGFFGGRGLVFIDGLGYRTSTLVHNTYPQMNIVNSVFGSGTSTAPADVNSRIHIRNYGDYACPSPSRQLHSIQRTNLATLENVGITLLGESDAYYATPIDIFSFNRIDTLRFQTQNMIFCNAPSKFIGRVESLDMNSDPYTNHNLWDIVDEQTCSDNPCDLLVGEVQNRNTMMLNGGSFLSVKPFKDDGHGNDDETETTAPYGPIYGYLFVVVEPSTQAAVMAAVEEGDNIEGGFVFPCNSDEKNEAENGSDREIRYIIEQHHEANDPQHRSWKIGQATGDRNRHITLVAHAQPEKVQDDHEIDTFYYAGTRYTNFAYTTSRLTLPPSDAGHYYTITSVVIDDDNGGQIKLTDAAFDPAISANLDGSNWYAPYAGGESAAQEAAIKDALGRIQDDPTYTFGLNLRLNNYFNPSGAIDHTPAGTGWTPQMNTVVSGNPTLITASGFMSRPIYAQAEGILPTIDFTLVYNTQLKTTVTRDVQFTMQEYDENGQALGYVYVTATISTIISDFDNMEAPLLAMFNDGASSQYVRKVVIPASFVERDLYLEKVEWYPTPSDVQGHGDAGEYKIQSAATPIPNYTTFAVSLQPTQKVTDNISNTLGWYDILPDAQDMDVYSFSSYTVPETTYQNNDGTPVLVDPIKKIGRLDGRAAAAFDVVLKYDGNLLYRDRSNLGHVKFHFKAVNTKASADGNYDVNTFYIDAKVWTREGGDTIYMAEAPNIFVYRDGTHDITGTNAAAHGGLQTTLYRFDPVNTGSSLMTLKDNYKKNDPIVYLSKFEHALDPDVYKEGDVICIMDSIHISDPSKQISMQAADYSRINVIRYAGSHFRWPGEKAAYRGPMVVVTGGGRFTVANTTFDGSGCARKAIPSSVPVSDADEDGWSNLTTGELTHGSVGANTAGTDSWFIFKEGSTYKKYWYHKNTKNIQSTDKDTTFSTAPIFVVRGAGNLRLRSNVDITNNFSNYTQGAVGQYPGGAIALMKTSTGSPEVVVGDMITINGNLLVDTMEHHDAISDEHHTHYAWNTPNSYGAGVYVDGGKLSLGATKEGNVVDITHNYYLPQGNRAAGSAYFTSGSKTISKPGGATFTLPYYQLVPAPASPATALHENNVYLNRVKPAEGTVDVLVATDSQSDVIYVEHQLGEGSRVGVSKWFPGFRDRDDAPRDVIPIVNYAKAGALAATNNFAEGIFIDDSVNYRDYDVNGSVEDNVDMINSSMLDPTTIFLHRCASLIERPNVYDSHGNLVEGPITYELKPDVVCPGDGDIIHYHIQGGSLVDGYTNYRFVWSVKNDEGNWEEVSTFIDETTDGMSDGPYVPLGLSLKPSQNETMYNLKVEAFEPGNCSVSHYVDVLVKQVGSADAEGTPTGHAANDFAGGLFVDNGDEDYLKHDALAVWAGAAPDIVAAAGVNLNVPGAYCKSSTADNDVNTAHVARLYTYYKLSASVFPVKTPALATVKTYSVADNNAEIDLATTKLCPGDEIKFDLADINSNYEFMMWDSDPSAGQEMTYIVQREDDHLTAYLTPEEYWYKHINSFDKTNGGYTVDYHGNVTITNEEGLAWLISTVNGLNGQQAQTFIFDTITVKDKGTPYDMSGYKWTPVGTVGVPFRGVINFEYDRSTDVGAKVVQVTVNEPELPYVGFFGVVDSATIDRVNISNSLMRGNAYGGGVIGYAKDHSTVTNSHISSIAVSASNALGSLAGKADDSFITENITDDVKLVGNAIYAGGLVGHAVRTVTQDPAVDDNYDDPTTGGNGNGNDNPQPSPKDNESVLVHVNSASNNINFDASKLYALYLGGVFGYSEGTEDTENAKSSKAIPTVGHVQVNNNFVNMVSSNRSMFVGGLIGYANTTDLQNNYAYGKIDAMSASGGLVGRVGDNVNVNQCFYQEGSAQDAFGDGGAKSVKGISSFSGSGNQVKLKNKVNGVDNLTRVLNLWVRDHKGKGYQTWSSDLEGVNGGFPIFGKPDMVPVFDTIHDIACDTYNWRGSEFNESGSYTLTITDSTEFIDSTIVLMVTISHTESTAYTDTINLGEDYMGYGFDMTADEIKALINLDDRRDVHILQVFDSLYTINGCDSIVGLTLTVKGKKPDEYLQVSAYPNPTTSHVVIEAKDVLSIEVYDALTRQIDYIETNDERYVLDLSKRTSGFYYVRVRTKKGAVVEKIYKK